MVEKNWCQFFEIQVIQYWHKELDILFCSITPTNLGQFEHAGGVSKLSEPADFKTDPGIENWPRFVGVIEQNKV